MCTSVQTHTHTHTKTTHLDEGEIDKMYRKLTCPTGRRPLWLWWNYLRLRLGSCWVLKETGNEKTRLSKKRKDKQQDSSQGSRKDAAVQVKWLTKCEERAREREREMESEKEHCSMVWQNDKSLKQNKEIKVFWLCSKEAFSCCCRRVEFTAGKSQLIQMRTIAN